MRMFWSATPIRRGSIVSVVLVAAVSGRAHAASPTTDPDFPMQWGLRNTGQIIAGQAGTAGADVDIDGAWAVHTGTPPVLVAILGSGVDPHPEFADRLRQGRALIGDLFDTADTRGIGTHIAGIIGAARDNGLGIAGINPRAALLPVRITDGAQSSELVAAEGIRWAVDQNARVIVVTRTYHTGSQPLADAVTYAVEHDVLVIAPVGDEENPEVLYPAAWEGCLAVSATTNQDAFASVSNWGAGVELSAPGQSVWSTARGSVGYEYRSGSTMAAGFVAGAASLIRSYAPQLTAAEVRQLLVDTAVDLGEPGADDHFGAGRLDAAAALAMAAPPALRFELIDSPPRVLPPQDGATFRVRIAQVDEQLVPASAVLFHRVGTNPYGMPSSLTSLGDSVYEATIPPAACGAIIEFYLRARGHLGSFVTDPIDAPTVVYQAEAIVPRTLFHDDFEADRGWTVGVPPGEPVSGVWVRDVPVGTSVQPGFDASPGSGGSCYLTGQYFGGADSLTDLDGGPVTLTSPDIPLPGGNVEVLYAAWFRSQNGEPDVLRTEVSTDAGGTWTTVEVIESDFGWANHVLRLSTLSDVPGASLRVRFSATDAPNDSLTEAAIDEFRVTALQCQALRGDVNGDGLVNLADSLRLLDCLAGPDAPIPAGACGAVDLNRDGSIDLRDVQVLQTLLSAG